MEKLSVAMIVKNESSCLDRCLNSVKDADEIVICDTGSEDDTIEIAKKYTDKVYTDFVWCDDFAAARNHAKAKATHNWILSIDADETLEENGIEKIKKYINSAPEELGAFSISLKGVNSHSIHKFPRLFKKDKCEWRGAIHETVQHPNKAIIDVEIQYGYSEAHKKDPQRSMRILTAETEKDPTNARNWYYLSREYWYIKDYNKAIELWEHYLTLSNFKDEKADAFLMLARCYWLTHQGDKARERCLSALNLNANFKEAAFVMADISFPENGRVWKAMGEAGNNKNVLFIRTPHQSTSFTGIIKDTIDVVMLANSETEELKKMTQRAIDSLHYSSMKYRFNVYLIETQTGEITYKNATVIQPNEPFNYNRFLNIGFEKCKSNYIVIANNDLYFHQNWFEEIVAANPDSASPYCPGWKSHRDLPIGVNAIGHRIGYELCGWCIVMKKSTLEKIGKFDEQFDFFHQDNDYAMQLKINKIPHVLVGRSIVEHFYSKSHSGFFTEEGQKRAKESEKKLKEKYAEFS